MSPDKFGDPVDRIPNVQVNSREFTPLDKMEASNTKKHIKNIRLLFKVWNIVSFIQDSNLIS